MEGKDEGRLFVLPFRGEFGIKLLRHVCRVAALRHPRKVVVCEEGEEALYPSAKEHLICTRNADERRRDLPERDGSYVRTLTAEIVAPRLLPADTIVWLGADGPRSYFHPTPFVAVRAEVVPDVVICPRRRTYGSSKNWPHWQTLVEELKRGGVERVVAAGAADSSVRELDSVIPCSWSHPRPLDCTIHWLRQAKLVVATDAGLAHLAVWCGRPLLLVSHLDGRVAPGPVSDEHGTVFSAQYLKIDLAAYQSENHSNSRIELLPHSWQNPKAVAARILELLAAS